MRSTATLVLSLALSCAAAGAVAETVAAAAPPPTRIEKFEEVLHGVTVTDPYRWLENGADPEVKAWTAAQTAHARRYLDALPVRARLRPRIEQFITESSPRYYGLHAAGERVFAMYMDPAKQQPLLRLLGKDLDPAKARTVLDPNVLDTSGGTAIDWYVPSPDGKRVAFALSKGGSEDGTLHIFDTDTGKLVEPPIPHVTYPTAGGDLTWAADGNSFWYTRYPGEERPADDRHFYVQVYFHRIGAPAAEDRHAFGRELPKIAEIQLDHSAEAGKLLVSVQNGDGGEFAHFVGDEQGEFTQVTRFEDGVDFVAFGPDRALYLVSERDAPRRQVLKLAPGVFELARATVFVPQGEDAIPIEFFGEDPLVFAGDRMYINYVAGGPSRVRAFALDGSAAGDLPLPGIAAVGELEAVGGDLIYEVETYLEPARFHRWSDGRTAPTALAVTSPVRFDDVEVVRAFAPSRDGTRVPLNIIRKKGFEANGNNPVLLYGYGGYGINLTPGFLGGARRLWFDAGGVYVVANLRGGGEYGESWHQQGMLTRKQNVFDDFIGAAEFLIRERYTSPARLAIMGGSNGGLLVGAAMTQRPELFRAVVAQVALLDMLRFESEPNGVFNVTEFGSIANEEQFRVLRSYSPYARVQDGVKYPAVLMATGENDGRVNPMYSRKMTARLQAATASGLPVYLATNSAAGHGIGSPLAVRIDQTADYTAFLMDQLGMTLP